jgi:hypothetical protein
MANPDAAASSGPSWHADPLVRVPRWRWWAGDHWTAWVVASPADGPSIAWEWALADLPHPIRWGAPVVRVAAAPPLLVQPQLSPAITTPPLSIDAPPQAVGHGPPIPLADTPAPTPLQPPAPPGVPLDRPAASAPADPVITLAARSHRPHRRRRHLVPLAATLSLVLGGVAGAGLLSSGTPRPALSSVVSYRDPAAGLSFAYPSTWRVQHRDPGQGVTFLAGGAAVPNTARALVAVTVGSQRGPLPALSDFERTALSTLSAQDPGLRVSGGGEATLAGGPALDVVLTNPPTTIETVEGRTADLRPLAVTVATRDPRGVLTRSTVQDFLASIGS